MPLPGWLDTGLDTELDTADGMASLTFVAKSARIVSQTRVSLTWLGDLSSLYPPRHRWGKWRAE